VRSYGIAAGSLRRSRPQDGIPFGAAVWALGYLILPRSGLCSAAAAFWLLANIWS
jgi:hypothetical protein